MSTQPEALDKAGDAELLAEEAELIHLQSWQYIQSVLRSNAAELRRLHAENEALSAQHEAAKEHAAAALALLSRMRFACGDNGARMQDELEQYLRELRQDAERYRWLRTRWGRVGENYVGDSDKLSEVWTIAGDDGWDVDPISLDAAIDAALQHKEAG